MPQLDLNQLALEIIEKNQYMTLASDNWASPVCYTFDKDYNFYWVSMLNSRHSQNIEKNPNISVAIFDSRQLVDTGIGLQIEGIAKKLELAKYPLALKLYFGCTYPYGKISLTFKKLLDSKTYLFYQFTPTTIWLNDPAAEIDTRIAVKLS